MPYFDIQEIDFEEDKDLDLEWNNNFDIVEDKDLDFVEDKDLDFVEDRELDLEWHNNFDISGEVIADMPNPSLYQLNGRMKLTFKTNLTKNEENPNGETHSIPLDAKQLLLKGAKLKNTKWVIGIE